MSTDDPSLKLGDSISHMLEAVHLVCQVAIQVYGDRRNGHQAVGRQKDRARRSRRPFAPREHTATHHFHPFDVNCASAGASLFRVIDDALMVQPEVECLKATFDANTGLPLKLEGGCPWLSDSSWSLEVSDISVEPRPALK
jgi:hypothetical protein